MPRQFILFRKASGSDAIVKLHRREHFADLCDSTVKALDDIGCTIVGYHRDNLREVAELFVIDPQRIHREYHIAEEAGQ